MNVEELRNYCLSKKGAQESFPFGEETLVFKVGGKIFAITGLDSEETSVNLKCEPEKAVRLREEYADVIPGFHMNKKHWNTVYCERELSNEFICELIDHSYDLIYQKLSKKSKAEVDAQ